MKKGCISIFLDTKKLRKGGLYKRKKEGRLLELDSYTSDGNRVLAFNVLFVFLSNYVQGLLAVFLMQFQGCLQSLQRIRLPQLFKPGRVGGCI